MKLPEKQQILIFFAGLLLISGFVMLKFYPLASKNRAIQKAQAEHMAKIQNAFVQRKELERIRKQAVELTESIGDYDAKIPAGREFATLWQEIANVMNAQNLKEQLVQPGTEIEGEEINRIPINIQCNGTFQQIFDLFDSLEKLDRFVRIDRIQLINDKDFSGRVTLKAEANVYYRPVAETEI